MIAGRGARFATAILLIGLASYALSRAAAVLSFAIAEQLTTAENATARLRPFLDGPEFGARAQLDILALDSGAVPADRARNLSRLLALTPLASGAWLDLAVARLSAGAGTDKAAASLFLSNLTGPNESDLMAGRAIFGLPLWSVLSSDLRQRLVIDLIGGWDSIGAVDRAGLTLALSIAPDEMRAQISRALPVSGARSEKIRSALGLASQESSPGQKHAR